MYVALLIFVSRSFLFYLDFWEPESYPGYVFFYILVLISIGVFSLNAILTFPLLIFRISTTRADNNGHFQVQGSDSFSSEDGKIPDRCRLGSLDAMANCGIVGGDESDNGLDANGQDGLQILTETSRGYVNNNKDTPTTNNEQEETVYTRASTARESQLRSVNNRDGLNRKNRFEEGDEFD